MKTKKRRKVAHAGMGTQEFIEASRNVSGRVISFLMIPESIYKVEPGETVPTEDRLTNEEIRFLHHCEHLNQAEVAAIFGISPQAVGQWRDCPKSLDGSYNLKTVWYYRIAMTKGQ